MEILLAVGVMALCFAGMGAGLLLSRKVCLRGSCAGAASKGFSLSCLLCGGSKDCQEENPPSSKK